MKKQKPLRLFWFIVIFLIAFVAGMDRANNSQNEGPVSFVPTVTATNPAHGVTV